MKKVLFIDRDGTILREPADEQVDSIEKFSFVPGAISGLARIARETDYEMVLVTNQDGLGTKSFPEENYWPLQNLMTGILDGEGVKFAETFIDRTFPQDNAPTRKPGTAMLTRYLAQGIDLDNSWVIGDRVTDIQLAKNLGCKSIFFSKERNEDAEFCSSDWNEICNFLKQIPRVATVERKTKETNIWLSVNLDGTGKSSISTGVGFFDHMLDQIARHGSFDIEIKAKGDTNVDNHHIVEDIALCLGEAFNKAAGSRKGIIRYSFVLPMDDCLAQVAIDFGGRPWLVWEAEFKSTVIGEMPTEMFYHFFKSFSDTARCNMNITASGTNEHHKIEAVFKAFARTLKAALKPSGEFSMPSTKGKL